MLSHRPSYYGPEYEQLLVTAFNHNPFRLPLQSPGKAKIFKARFYGYCRALREENLRMDLIEMADNLSLAQEDSMIIFTTKQDSWEAQAIRAALGLTPGFHLHGNTGPGEMHVPDLLGQRLQKRLDAVRDRQTGKRQQIVPPDQN